MAGYQLTQRTPAEAALIERAEAAPVNSQLIGAHHRSAVEKLRLEGLPHRRVEAWHYTDLRTLAAAQRERWLSAEARQQESEQSLLSPLLANSVVIETGSGAALPVRLPQGLTVAPVGAVPDWRVSLNHGDRDFDTIRLLSAALGSAGTRVDVAAGSCPSEAIEFRPAVAGEGQQSYRLCGIGSGARVTMVERLPAGSYPSISTSVTDLTIDDAAEVLWIIDQAKNDGETHFGQLNVTLGTGAKLRLFVLNAGGALVRQEVHAETRGEGADIQIRGVNLLKAGQHVDVTTTLRHTVPHTTSTETFRNVVTGGHGVFQGMIKVAKGAQKTDARMACNSLLLSDEGDFSAKPELEIFADDVQCGHGATAGEIDRNQLFYLMSRGIPERPARALLVKAFVAEVVEQLEHEAAIEALEARIDEWLAAHA